MWCATASPNTNFSLFLKLENESNFTYWVFFNDENT